MLDKRTLKLLDVLNNECQGAGYRVFYINDLKLMLPENLALDENGIRESLSALSEREYISVKYQDDLEVCLCPLPKGRLVFENRLDEEIEKKQNARKYFLYSALGGFLGGFLATVLAVGLFLLLGAINA